MTISINLAVEDSLSEAVARKILYQTNTEYIITNCLGHQGCGYLKRKINAFNIAAKEIPFLVIVDQDSGCPPEKISSWLKHNVHPNLIFRIAVMEIESWVMADRNAIADFLSVPAAKFPNDMDSLKDPKQYLLNIARKSRLRKLVSDIVPKPGSTAKVGPNYNARISDFIRNKWNVKEAIKHSKSLFRAFHHLEKFNIS